MTRRYFDSDRVESDDENNSNPEYRGMTNSEIKDETELDQTESETTRFIRSSMERSQKFDLDRSLSTIQQVVNISSNAISRIPILINQTDSGIRKAISTGKQGIQTITDLKNSLYPAKED
jgi:hypothetical protein